MTRTGASKNSNEGNIRIRDVNRMSSKTENKNSKNGDERQQTSFDSGTSLEQDHASVQKLQHLQTALKHLQVNRVKEKHERQTLSTLFQEEKEMKDKLLQLNKKLTYSIQVLKKRLDDNHLPSSLDGKTDTTKPQTSKQLLSDLMKQNAELKQRLTECSNFDIPLKETQLQRIHDLEDRLEKELFEKNLLEERIKQMGTSSNDEKDAKIVQLESELERLRANSNVQEVLSQSLMDEVVTVNRRLQDTAKTYQEVVLRLQGKNVDETEGIVESLRSIEIRFPERRTSPPQSHSDSLDGHDSENTEENKKLKSENIKLKSELTEAVDVNKRWNSYNQQREAYVKKQQEKITQLEERLKRLQEPDGGAEDRKKLVAELDKLKSDHSKTCKVVKDLKAKLQIITEQKDVYQSRNRELMQSMENSPWYRELKDKVYHLQAQVQTMTEDFQNERKDRENAQGRLSEMETELAYYKRYEHAGGHYGGAVDLRSLEREQKYTPFGRCAPAFGNLAPQQRTQIIAHSPGPAADNLHGSGSDNDSLQTNPDLSSGSSRGLAQALSRARSEEDLQCPRCHKLFPSGQHQRLLEHMDTCCD
ncbi:TNFAIP3-interacting protein 2-like [Lineus longissimus]|uniref:TNFAIP3-interacting protein 2-like n=1 Tax=Lineus longissimus TaxID=88925 RepID=UPI002B4DA6EC